MVFGEGGSYDTARFGVLHHAEYDPTGLRLATASADNIVRIWSTDTQEMLSELRLHRAPVWSLSWANARQMAPTIASASSDGVIVIWREVKPREWQAVHQVDLRGPVPTVAFAPAEHGVVLAVARENGEVVTLSQRMVAASPVLPAGEQWNTKSFFAHNGGIVALSWAPGTTAAILATGPSAARATSKMPKRLVTAGADGVARTWLHDEKTDSWTEQSQLSSPNLTGSLRDIVWRPNIGIPSSFIAACTDAGTVAIWSQEVDGGQWQLQAFWDVGQDARRLAWSKAGLMLGVSVGDAGTLLYREAAPGSWSLVSSCDE